ncbi:MAG TPA: MlaD family protein [Mycobacteriales bacterium]|nr:MlaD family protein [Mycobacteriales bacterium]
MKTTGALIKLVIFMVVTSMLTFVLAATIGNFGAGNTASYHVRFTDVTGLLPGNEVRIAGVKVGSVKGMSLKGDQADVVINMQGGHRLTEGNTVQVRYRNLVGERYLAVQEGAGSSTPLKPNATVPVERTQPALDLTLLFNGFRPLFQALDPKTINEVSFEIIKTLQGEGGTIDALLARTASLTNSLADKDAVIGRVVDNLTAVLTTVDQRDTELSDLIVQLRRLAEGFAQDRQDIGASIEGIGELTDATAGLLAGIRPSLRSDIESLGDLAANLDKGKGQIDGVLQRLPEKLNRIVATASYGGWFNFYLCGVRVNGVDTVNRAERCKR